MEIIHNTIKLIIQNYGIDILRDGNRTVAYFSDLAPRKDRERKMIQSLVKCGGNIVLLDSVTDSPAVRKTKVQKLVKRMTDETLISDETAYEICNSFLLALGTQAVTYKTKKSSMVPPNPSPSVKQTPTSIPTTKPPAIKKNRFIAVIACIALIVAIAVGVAYFISNTEEPNAVTNNPPIIPQIDTNRPLGNTSSYIVGVSAGYDHAVGLRADGTVVAAGANNFGQCEVTTWTDIVAVSAGDYFTIGLKSDGTVLAAGKSDSGQCDVYGWRDIISVSAGSSHTVGLKSDGTVVAVGDKQFNKCDIDKWTDIIAISAGGQDTCAIKKDGTIIGTGNITSWYTSLGADDAPAATHISVGYDHIAWRYSDGTTWASGDNQYGELNTFAWANPIVQVSAGHDFTVGLQENGKVVTTGGGEYGWNAVSSWSDIVSIDAGGNFIVGLKSDGSVVAVGNNYYGQCNVSDWYLPVDYTAIEESKKLNPAVAISAGSMHIVVLKSDTSVVSIGDDVTDEYQYGTFVDEWKDVYQVTAGYYGDAFGVKGDGTVVASGFSSFEPEEIAQWTDIVKTAAGDYHVIGLKRDGSVVVSSSMPGNLRFGQVDVTDWTKMSDIAAGDYHSVGLRSDGTVVAVGDNSEGQCDVSSWRNIIAISAAGSHTLGLKADGTVVATGNTNDNRCDVDSWTDIIAISAGGDHSVGLKADGTVVSVGANVNGTYNLYDWTDIVSVSAGDGFTIGLKSDGTIVCVNHRGYKWFDINDIYS